MLNKVREEKGITLVVLIITIIVLLILAGVTLNMVIGENGILEKECADMLSTFFKELREKKKLNS